MTEPKTIVGAGAIVTGNIEGDTALFVEGTVEGNVSLSKSLIVEPEGTVTADVTVESALVRGALVGEIRASRSVHIAAGGRVVGDIRAVAVVLEEGAFFKGNIDMGDPEPAAGRPTSPAPRGAATSPSGAAPFAVRWEAPFAPDPSDDMTSPASSPPQRLSRRPQPRSSRSVPPRPPQSEAAGQVKPLAPVPKVRAIGKIKIKRRGE